MVGPCQLCGRTTALTRHHLVPQCRHNKKRTRREFSRAAVTRELLVGLCSACHQQVHALLTEKELARDYPSLERLREHPGVRRFVAWIRDKPADFRPQVNASRAKAA